MNTTDNNDQLSKQLFQSSRCVCCGDYVPEGRMVCSKCLPKEDEDEEYFSSREFLDEVIDNPICNPVDNAVDRETEIPELKEICKKRQRKR